MEPAALLDLIARTAQSLRSAGITRIAFGDVAIEFAPFTGVGGAAESADRPVESSDPLNDPATYAGGKVPGYVLTDFQDLADGEEPNS